MYFPYLLPSFSSYLLFFSSSIISIYYARHFIDGRGCSPGIYLAFSHLKLGILHCAKIFLFSFVLGYCIRAHGEIILWIFCPANAAYNCRQVSLRCALNLVMNHIGKFPFSWFSTCALSSSDPMVLYPFNKCVAFWASITHVTPSKL